MLKAARLRRPSASQRGDEYGASSSMLEDGQGKSRLKRMGSKISKRSKDVLKGSSGGFLQKIRRASAPRTPVLKNLIRFRKDLDGAESTSTAGETNSSRGSFRLDGGEPLIETPIIPSRRRSIRPGHEWSESPSMKIRRLNRTNGLSRSACKRVSLRGFTKEEGLVTRAQAKDFSKRFSLDRSQALTPEQVIGRNSISIKTLLRVASQGDADKVVALIESTMISVNAYQEPERTTALHLAASHGHTALVVALYGLEADLELPDRKGNTALMRAADAGHLEVVLTLLSCGADSTKRNRAGETALVRAAKRICKVHSPEDVRTYLEIVKCFFERTVPPVGCEYIEEYREDDSKFINDASIRTLLKEWTVARARRKDLHMPTSEMLKKGKPKNLSEFFHRSHMQLDVYGWVKVLLLLLFIVYDVYQPHFSNTYTTMTAYLLLYCAAYYC